MMASLTSLHNNIQQSLTEFSGPKQTTIDLVGGILCHVCRLTYATKQCFDSHYRSHGPSAEIIYSCNICYKEIVGYPSFRGHCYTSHVIKERFQCEHCLKQFSKISNLKDHVNRIHKFKCPTCRKEFPSKKEMVLHRIIHNGLDQPPYNCNTCQTEIDTADECKEHVEKHLKFLYSCPICSDNIIDKENAAHHMKTHFDQALGDDKNDQEPRQPTEDTAEEMSGIMCRFCCLVLGDRVKFDAHFSCKHGDEDIVYMCVECGKSFEKYSVFKNHCEEHTLRNMYKCELCKKSFPRLSMLAAHTVACQVAGSARGRKVFPCPSCERRFASMSRWREHLRVAHDMDRHLPCPYKHCDRTFDTPKQLILHQQSHEITDQKFCSQCRLIFSNAASCERHIDTHKKKLFFCPICKRNAKDKKVIINHISKHFEVISHLCRVCGKVFNSKNRLIEHLKIHKKVKSYSCSHCNKSFVKPSQLEQHVNTHTGTKPYKCPLCVKSFSNYPNWVKHVRRMHHEKSIYIRKPTVENPDGVDTEDSTMEIAVNENNYTKSNNQINNDICLENKKDNNNYQVSNIKEQISIMNSDPVVTEVHRVKSIDIKNSFKDDILTINGQGFTMEIAVDEAYDIPTSVHIDEIKSNIIEINHNKKCNIIQVDNPVSVRDESLPTETIVNKRNGLAKDTQKDNIEQNSIADEPSSTLVSSKPHKCPICEKTFAKHSYMSKHIGRVHHIRTIDIKNIITDHQDTVEDEVSVTETTLNEENDISTDNLKDDSDEQVSNTDKVKIQIYSNIEHQIDGSKQYKCPICDKSFAKYPYMTKHVRKIHHKKAIDIKNSITHHLAVVDEILPMETGVGDDNDKSADAAKDESNDQIPNSENRNLDLSMLVSLKPHKCPICEKSFAKHPYLTKHIRKVHNKKNIDMKSPIVDHKESFDGDVSPMETSIDGEGDISIDNVKDDNGVQILNIEKISNVEHVLNGPKPYKCSTCDKSFAKHSYMTKHVRTVHNKKVIDIKSPIIDHKECVDDDGSNMETVVDEDTEAFTDHSKDDYDERVSNADIQLDYGYKPYKCPMCEKTFAKDRYCRKHVRRVHYKNMAVKSPIFDPAKGSAVEFIETEDQTVASQEYLNNELSNTNSIANIVTQSSDCLNYIDNANASIDFANVRLESYIFSDQRDSPMDIVPSMPDGKYLLNDNNDGNATMNKDLFKENGDDGPSMGKDIIYESKRSTQIATELVNENGEAIALVEKDLFNANDKESPTVEKGLFSGNSEENDNPIDILEYIAEMPENNSLFVPVITQESLAPSAQPPAEGVTYPCEYGPEFSASFDAACPNGFIDLDDHMLPHIDPLLTINNQPCVQMHNAYQNYDCSVIDAADLLALGNEACNKAYAQTAPTYSEYNVTVAAADYAPGWGPPVITKLCDQYAYGYGEMPEASRVPIMNTDIF